MTKNRGKVQNKNQDVLIDASSIIYKGKTTLDNMNDYSTEEKIIGTWTDNKPIYRRIIDGIIPNGIPGTDIYQANYIDNIVNYWGLYYQSNNQVKKLNFWFGTNDFMTLNYNKVNKVFILDSTSNYGYQGNGTIRLIIEYTKTTD